nr:vegetative cell wall protein gp1-like [Aegilops tauschii subsp. strangulata]
MAIAPEPFPVVASPYTAARRAWPRTAPPLPPTGVGLWLHPAPSPPYAPVAARGRLCPSPTAALLRPSRRTPSLAPASACRGRLAILASPRPDGLRPPSPLASPVRADARRPAPVAPEPPWPMGQ